MSSEARLADECAVRAYGIAQDVLAVAPLGNGVGSLCTAVEELAEAVRRLAGEVARLSKAAPSL